MNSSMSIVRACILLKENAVIELSSKIRPRPLSKLCGIAKVKCGTSGVTLWVGLDIYAL